MQSVQYCSPHLLHMDIFSGSDLVQQRAHTSPSSPTTSSSSLSSCVGAVHTCAGTSTDHMDGTVLVFESDPAANARVHTRTHATQYRIPSICSSQCPNATCVQTSAQYVRYRNHAHRCIPFGARSKSFDRSMAMSHGGAPCMHHPWSQSHNPYNVPYSCLALCDPKSELPPMSRGPTDKSKQCSQGYQWQPLPYIHNRHILH